MYFVFDRDPSKLKEIIMYIKAVESSHRNRTEDRTEHIFADVEWEIFTGSGFTKVNARDFTSAFVASGEVRIPIPK